MAANVRSSRLENHDLSTEPSWSLSMSLAWIAWRNMADVRRHWDEYRQVQPEVPSRSNYFYLLNDELIQRDEGNPPLITIADARRELWQMLLSGHLQMSAIDIETNAPGPIPGVMFAHLEPGLGDGNILELPRTEFHVVDAYREPRIATTALLELWPRKSEEAQSQQGASNVAPKRASKMDWSPTWLSLAATMMWVWKRNTSLARRVHGLKNRDESILLSIEVCSAAGEPKTGAPVRSWMMIDEVWPAIRELIADEKIAAEGRSVERRGLDGGIETWHKNQPIPSQGNRI